MARAGPLDADRAVAAARAAFEDGRWSGLKPERRAAVLQAVAAKLKEEAARLVDLEVRDSGGTIRKTRSSDVSGAMFTFRTYAELATRLPAEVPLPFTVAPGPSHNYLRREPVGVCAAIVPWNFPIQNAAWKLAPALAAGNSVVLKPAEQTPCTAIELAKLCTEAGVPDGVVNVLPGFGPEAGEPLVTSPGVDKVAFTGSTEVGRRVAAPPAGKKVLLELGGKSANILLDDADLELAADGAAYAIFFHQGQVCTAGSRLLVARPIHDEVVARLVDIAERITVGPAADPASDMGPLISAEQLARVEGYVRAGQEEGAKLATGGHRVEVPGHEGGFYFAPTIFTGADPASRIAQEEIFGPVLTVIPVGRRPRGRRGQRLPVRPGRRRLEPRLGPRRPGGRAPAHRHGLGQRLPPPQPPVPLRRLQAVRRRPRARRAGVSRVHPDQARPRRHHPAARPPPLVRRHHPPPRPG